MIISHGSSSKQQTALFDFESTDKENIKFEGEARTYCLMIEFTDTSLFDSL
jgi:hypothetical protein